MKTVQVNSTTNKVFAVVTPELKNVTPPANVTFVNVADTVDVQPGDTYDPAKGTFSRV